jgi:hypothetical protein
LALRIIFSVLLACSLLVAINVPQVVTQSIVTSYQYATTSLTTTMYSTSLMTNETSRQVSYVLTPGDYNSRTDSFTLSFTETTNIRYFADLDDYPCLFYDYFLFNATSGHTIRSHFQLSMVGRGIDFLILNSWQFWSFEHSNCGRGLGSSMLHVFAPSSSVDWLVPETGEYALVFASPVFYGGQIYFSAQDYSAIVQSETATSTLTSIFQNTQSILSTLPTQPITTSVGGANTGISWFAAILLVTVGVGIILLVLRKRR